MKVFDNGMAQSYFSKLHFYNTYKNHTQNQSERTVLLGLQCQ